MSVEDLLRRLVNAAAAGRPLDSIIEEVRKRMEDFELVKLAGRGYAPSPARKVCEVATVAGPMPIYLHKATGRFYCHVGEPERSMGITGDTIEHARAQAAAAWAKVASITWSRVVKIEWSGVRRTEREASQCLRAENIAHLKSSVFNRTVERGSLAITISRYLFGLRWDGSQVWAEWVPEGIEVPAETTGHTGGVRFAAGPRAVQSAGGFNAKELGGTWCRVIEYDEATWSTLVEIVDRIEQLRVRLVELMTADDLVARIALAIRGGAPLALDVEVVDP